MGSLIRGAAVAVSIYIISCVVFGMFVFIGIPVYILDKVPPIHRTFTAVGIKEDDRLIGVKPIAINWSTDGQTKVLIIQITNRSGEPWSKFNMECSYDHGWDYINDESGLMPNETSTRVYKISSTTATMLKDCTLAQHWRGKPRAFDASEAFQFGDGGWGDRLADSQINTAPMDTD